ncbi:MAG: SDR family NAD(P)-dependent oxidoreductase [Lachnospiraceae bacterium]|jgi:3-oxoacyl-[acyl-carrier protein] reductase|nr:SDR family NAD(P)-dependent oxidoreductase [Lachnospiraceae bacterium]
MQSKVAFITGASRGIGRAIAEEFARHGYCLAINCKNSGEALLSYAEELANRYHVTCLPLFGDAGEEPFIIEAFQAIDHKFGRIDVLVNNAGISKIGLLADLSLREWNQILQTNLTSLFCCCKHAIPRMLRSQSGSILNISSVWGTVGASCEVAYSASKGGVNAFTKALAKELAPSHISVNAIAFGVIDTQMNQCFTPEERSQLMEEIPAGRFGAPLEAAQLALTLVEAPSYLTGQVVAMDGGWQ